MGIIDNLKSLDITSGPIIAEYIWIDASGGLRAKARTLKAAPASVSDLPDWNFDGSSTGQAPGEDSEVIIKPQAFYPDPFRGAPHILVMTDCYTPAGEPIPSNTRFACAAAMESAKDEEPWFGLEQEYFMIDPKTTRPVGFPADGSDPPAQGPYYCGVGGSKLFGRDIVDAHYKACLYSGIKISGINAEVAPGQWEYQVGPATGIEQGDMLWMSRYILERIAEVQGIDICYDAKPVKGDWNGTGCHTNFSTKAMRAPGGYEAAIVPALEKLALKHDEHIAAYGAGNEERLTGKHETASISTFKWGVADRGASCRVGHETKENGCGYVSHCPCTSFSSNFLTRCIDRSSDVRIPSFSIARTPTFSSRIAARQATSTPTLLPACLSRLACSKCFK
jgi:glutamine synthetase